MDQIREAHDLIVKLYGQRAMAALDRGDRMEADRWLARIERAANTTDVHLQLAELSA